MNRLQNSVFVLFFVLLVASFTSFVDDATASPISDGRGEGETSVGESSVDEIRTINNLAEAVKASNMIIESIADKIKPDIEPETKYADILYKLKTWVSRWNELREQSSGRITRSPSTVMQGVFQGVEREMMREVDVNHDAVESHVDEVYEALKRTLEALETLESEVRKTQGGGKEVNRASRNSTELVGTKSSESIVNKLKQVAIKAARGLIVNKFLTMGILVWTYKMGDRLSGFQDISVDLPGDPAGLISQVLDQIDVVDVLPLAGYFVDTQVRAAMKYVNNISNKFQYGF